MKALNKDSQSNMAEATNHLGLLIDSIRGASGEKRGDAKRMTKSKVPQA
jgi:Lhr-like helicase